jgi:hypothetical protein
MLDHLWGFIDKTGTMIIKNTYGGVAAFTSDGLAPVAIVMGPNGALFGYIDTKGEMKIKPQFEIASTFHEGFAFVRLFGQNISFIDTTGKAVIPPQFLSAGDFSEGLAAVQAQATGGVLWGFIDKTGKNVIPLQYLAAQPFSSGLAAVQTPQGKWGYIDKKNNFVIAPQWESASAFLNGLAQVWVSQEKYGYIGTDGKYVWEPSGGVAAPPAKKVANQKAEPGKK